MNKLYVIQWTLSNGYIVSVSYFWNESELYDKMRKNPEWSFDIIEDNNTHKIIRAF